MLVKTVRSRVSVQIKNLSRTCGILVANQPTSTDVRQGPPDSLRRHALGLHGAPKAVWDVMCVCVWTQLNDQRGVQLTHSQHSVVAVKWLALLAFHIQTASRNIQKQTHKDLRSEKKKAESGWSVGMEPHMEQVVDIVSNRANRPGRRAKLILAKPLIRVVHQPALSSRKNSFCAQLKKKNKRLVIRCCAIKHIV